MILDRSLTLLEQTDQIYQIEISEDIDLTQCSWSYSPDLGAMIGAAYELDMTCNRHRAHRREIRCSLDLDPPASPQASPKIHDHRD